MKEKHINWTTDARMLELLARGVENLSSGQDLLGRSFLGAMGKSIAFRSMKLREAQFAKASKPKRRAKSGGSR